MQKKIKVMLIDDHPIVKMGIKNLIEIEHDMEVCCDSSDTAETIKLLNENDLPDIAVVDISLNGDMDGIELVKAIKSRFENIKLIILSMYDADIYAERAIKAGARGYVTKKDAPEKIITALRTIMKGDLYLDDKISRKIVDKLLHGNISAERKLVDLLSNREFEIFQLIGEGSTTGEIAKKLNLSISTIESHKSHIKEKLDIKSSTELTKYAIHWQLKHK